MGVRRGKRNGAHAARFILRWQNDEGVWVHRLWPLRHRHGCTPPQIGAAAFRFGCPPGTSVECVCRHLGMVVFGVSRNPDEDLLGAIRSQERRRESARTSIESEAVAV